MTWWSGKPRTQPPFHWHALAHAIFELTFVRILVTTRAIQILPVINDRWLGLKSRRFLVALRAGHGDMTTG